MLKFKEEFNGSTFHYICAKEEAGNNNNMVFIETLNFFMYFLV